MARRPGSSPAKRGPSFDPDVPVAGFYRTRLVKDGPPVALRIWFGNPRDPSTGDEMDRAPQWFATMNGTQVVEAARFWPGCAADPISFGDYLHICRRSATLDPADPYFDPTKPIDKSIAPPPF
jgi:hypothetical protein